ncbi:MAG: hypothetical protein JNM51_09570 [Bacteroidia bacterium]|nr:hypothetical protein [Bacteroidia bacterium]
MTELEFQHLPNSKIRFTTYTGKVYVGGNYVEHLPNKTEYYIITNPQAQGNLSKEEKIAKGILIPIKPSIIEEAIVIQ